MDSLLARLVELESNVSYRTAPEPGREEFSVFPGQIPVLLSAPHGAAHYRNGKLKPEDEYTAGLAQLVAEETAAYALFACRQSSTDPNYYCNTAYKRELQRLVEKNGIQFVLDLHGCSPDRAFGVGLGTMFARSCPRQRPVIIDTLESHGFSIGKNGGLMHLDIDQTFPAAGSDGVETVTRFAAEKLHVSAAQLEINAHLCIVQRLPGATSKQPFEGKPELILRTIRALIALVEVLSLS